VGNLDRIEQILNFYLERAIESEERVQNLLNERDTSYRLEISPVSEEPIKNLDNIEEIGFRIRNLTNDVFPGAIIGINVTRSNFESISVRNPLTIPEIQPNGNVECFIQERPLVSGAFAFFISFPDPDFPVYWRANNGRMVMFYLPDGRLLHGELLIHARRIMSKEENLSKIENTVSAISLVLLVLFTLYEWVFLRNYSQSDRAGMYVFGIITFLVGLILASVIFTVRKKSI